MRKNKTILIYSHDFPPIAGGGATYTFKVAHGLAALGHEVVVLAPKKNHSTEDVAIDAKCTFKVRRMGYRSSRPQGNIMRGFLALLKELLTSKPDLVVLIDTESHLAAALVRKIVSFRYIITVHEAMVISNIAKSKGFKFNLLRSLYQKAEAIVPVSQYLKSVIVDLGLAADTKITVIPTGVDKKLLSGQAEAAGEAFQTNGKTVLLSVARLEKRKGIDKSIRILPEIAKIFPNIKYYIIGSGEDDASLKKLVVDLGLADVVSFLGYVSNDRIHEYYDKCDVLLFPSILEKGCGEGLPVVLCEAGARATPVVAGDCGGVSEIIVHEETGLLVNAEDHSALKNAVLRLLREKDFRVQLGKRLKERVSNKFVWEKICDQIDQVVSRV